MNLSSPGIIYLLMVIPTLFACVVIGQGAYKMSKDEQDGKIIFGFGIGLLLLIVAAYFLFIR